MQLITLTIKRAFWVIFLCLVLTIFPQPSLAVTVQDVPNPQKQYVRGWVTDMANLFTPDTKLRLNQAISKFEKKSGTEIAVVTVPDTTPSATPKKFATQLFKAWGIGKKDINNGVLFLISKKDRRVEIETGKGIEKILHDVEVGNIINKEITPYFKKEDFAAGTIAGTLALITTLERRYILFPSANKHQLNLQFWISLLVLVVLAFVIFLWLFMAMNDGNANKHRRDNSDSGSGDSGGFWDSDSGGGFGGGDSGGGGDGGGW